MDVANRHRSVVTCGGDSVRLVVRYAIEKRFSTFVGVGTVATKVRRQDENETPSERLERAAAKVMARQERARVREERKEREAESSQRTANSS